MCLQISKGMEYLTEHKLVHRDLAARNCMYVNHFTCFPYKFLLLISCRNSPLQVSTNWDQLFNEMFHLCRLDQNFVIKVADFGLSENTYAKSYFRQQQTAGVKLPIKWMAYESLTDGIFSEKTDVVSSALNTSYWERLLQINVGFGLILSLHCNIHVMIK